MNLFWLDPALYPDPLLRKVIVEIAQQLSTAARVYLGDTGAGRSVPLYRVTHSKHVCVIWCARRRRHFRLACALGLLLCLEHRRRRPAGAAPHRTERLLLELWRRPPSWPARSMCPKYANPPRLARLARGVRVPLAMDRWCHHSDARRAYRTWVAHKLCTNWHQRYFHGSRGRARELFEALRRRGLVPGAGAGGRLAWRDDLPKPPPRRPRPAAAAAAVTTAG